MDLQELVNSLEEDYQASYDRKRIAEEALFIQNILNDTLPKDSHYNLRMDFQVSRECQSDYGSGYYFARLEMSSQLREDLRPLLERMLQERLAKLGINGDI